MSYSDTIVAGAVRSGDFELRFSPDSGVAEFRGTRLGASAGDVEARELMSWLAPQVAKVGRLAMIIDARGVRYATHAWRSSWFEFFLSIDKVSLVFWGTDSLIGTMARMFCFVAQRRHPGFRGAVLDTRTEAFSWVRSEGYEVLSLACRSDRP